MTLLSIVTVNLDDAEGLRATGESVAAQDFADREWLVVDGGSTDGSLAVISEFAGVIDHWSSEPDNGVYHAMNLGLTFWLVSGVQRVDPSFLTLPHGASARPVLPTRHRDGAGTLYFIGSPGRLPADVRPACGR